MSVEVGRRFDFAKYNNYEPRPGTPPVKLSTEDMVRRREYVMEELGRQGLEIDILTAKRINPYTGPRDKEGRQVPDDKKRWLQDYEGRFQRIISRKGGLDLGGGWYIHDVAADYLDSQALLFTARDAGGTQHDLRVDAAG